MPPKKLTLHVTLPAELRGAEKNLTVLPRIAEARRSVGRGVLALELKREAGKVRLALAGACTVIVDTRTLADGAAISLPALFDVGPPERVVGLGQRFKLQATPGCVDAASLRSEFSIAGGAPLLDVRAGAREFSARTTSAAPPKSTRSGIVPVSAHDAGRFRSQIRFRVELAQGHSFERTLEIAAIARSSGLPNVGLHHPVLLAGPEWRLLAQPTGSQAEPRRVGVLSELTPDLPGRYQLQHPDGRKLSLQSGRYDQTPLDCGRSDCHAAIARSVRASPMTQTLASDLGGCHSLGEPECASACHASGEPGVDDGGFIHIMTELGLPALPTEYDELPRALQRLGGVGCMACHGPGQIPEPEARSGILRNEVCAVCHDAPPRYGHVLALETSRMGHSDGSPETRRLPCARCHTSWGALKRPPPADDPQGGGISCATCHDVHPHGTEPAAEKSQSGLLRSFEMPTILSDAPASFHGISRVCISCHAPSSDSPLPEASAAAIVAGRGGTEPSSGAPLSGFALHAQAPRGCLSCHDSGPEQLVLGRSHGFRADGGACAGCHAQPPARDPALAARAQKLLEQLSPEHAAGGRDRPWHAQPPLLPAAPARARALRNVLLVLEDPAADVHNPGYAKSLLDAAQSFSP